MEVPLPNVVVDHLAEKGALSGGAAFYIGNAMVNTGLTPQEIAEKVNAGELDLVGTSVEIR
ncbi:MAG: lysine 5,6-aminomutase subunit alpha [Eubacterium sp.]